jgi:hypothetical protein
MGLHWKNMESASPSPINTISLNGAEAAKAVSCGDTNISTFLLFSDFRDQANSSDLTGILCAIGVDSAFS